MPSIRSTEPATMMRCIEGHVSSDGTFPAGVRVRADHPDVKRRPQLWVPDTATTAEVDEAIRRLRATWPA